MSHALVRNLVAALAAAVVAGPASAAPSPSSAASPSPANRPLKILGTIRALSPFCARTVPHANAAIAGALDNDARMTFTIANLRNIDLDGSAVKKQNGTRALREEYVALRKAAVDAEADIRALRSDADAAPDLDQKAELRRFADALGGALERQKKMSEELSRTIAYLDAHPPLDANAKAQFLFDVQWAQTVPGNRYHGDPRDYVPPALSEVAHAAGDRLSEDDRAVEHDEGTAAALVPTAFKSCL